GAGVGRTIEVPTANLAPPPRKMLPRDGIYAVRVRLEDEVKSGVLYIGFRPTLNGNTRTVEVHILEFSKEITEKTLCVEFVKYLREDRKFLSLEELKKQIFKDIDLAKKLFSD
ncbi:MAG: riboflavin kinase, partial [bacterium]